jgi:hypothetical protein
MTGFGSRLTTTVALATLLAVSSGCGASSATPNAPAATAGPTAAAATTPPTTPAPATPAQATQPPSTTAPATSPPSAPSLANAMCDPYLTGAEVASVAGPVAFVQGSEHQGLENQNATDLLCVYTLADRTTIRFQIAHELVNGHKADGSEMDPSEIDKVKHAGGQPVPGLGIVAFSVVVNGTADLVWQVSKKGVNTIEYELDGPNLDALLAIARLVPAPA